MQYQSRCIAYTVPRAQPFSYYQSRSIKSRGWTKCSAAVNTQGADLCPVLHQNLLADAKQNNPPPFEVGCCPHLSSTSLPPSLLPSLPQAISRMESLNPTPRLFMRSVNIMATNAAAPLIKWVLELLQRLITKQVGGGGGGGGGVVWWGWCWVHGCMHARAVSVKHEPLL